MTGLDHVLDRTVTIAARRETVFRTFTDSERFAAWWGAPQRFMPGLVLAREGEARQCQGLAIVDWSVKGPDGSPRGKGSNVFELAPNGRIARVTGIWA